MLHGQAPPTLLPHEASNDPQIRTLCFEPVCVRWCDDGNSYGLASHLFHCCTITYRSRQKGGPLIYRTGMTLALAVSLPLLAAGKVRPIISKSQAEQAALAAVKGATISTAGYQMEDGAYVWCVDVRANGHMSEVWVNPHSGNVMKVEKSSPSHEKGEQSRETKVMRRVPMSSTHGREHSSGVSKIVAGEIAMMAAGSGAVLSVKKVAGSNGSVWLVDVKTSEGLKRVFVSPANGTILKISRSGTTSPAAKN